MQKLILSIYALSLQISNSGGQRQTNTLITQDGYLSQLYKIKLLYTESKKKKKKNPNHFLKSIQNILTI